MVGSHGIVIPLVLQAEAPAISCLHFLPAASPPASRPERGGRGVVGVPSTGTVLSLPGRGSPASLRPSSATNYYDGRKGMASFEALMSRTISYFFIIPLSVD